jgi:hypothetical protein
MGEERVVGVAVAKNIKYEIGALQHYRQKGNGSSGPNTVKLYSRQ